MTGYTKSNTSTVRRYGFAQIAGSAAIASDPTPSVSDEVVGGVLIGSKNPYWRLQVRRHQDATTDMQASQTEIKDSPGYYYTIRKNKSTGLDDRWYKAAGAPYGGNVPVPLLGFVSTTSADNMAAGSFYRTARNKMSTFKGSVFAAEFREAKRMMVDRSKKILGSIDPYQRRLKKRWYGKGSKRSRLKLLSDSWLELQFGWRPLFGDIEDAIKALNNPRPQYSVISEFSNVTVPVSKSTSTLVVGIGVMDVTYEEHTDAFVKYYGEVRAYAEPHSAGPRQDFGFTAREFLPTLWEVIPWSFAIDYFTNVSDIVTATAYAGANFTWRAKVIKTSREITRTGVCRPVASNAMYDYRVERSSPFMSSSKTTSVARTRSVIVPIPSLTWEIPSLEQGLNLAALAASRRLRLFHV